MVTCALVGYVSLRSLPPRHGVTLNRMQRASGIPLERARRNSGDRLASIYKRANVQRPFSLGAFARLVGEYTTIPTTQEGEAEERAHNVTSCRRFICRSYYHMRHFSSFISATLPLAAVLNDPSSNSS